MTNFRDKQASKQAFLDIARSKPELEGVGQLLDAIGTHLALVGEAAIYEADRNFQDSYLTTALTRPAILAASYDRNYVPRKAVPSSGSIRVVNRSESALSVPSGLILVSQDQLLYETIMPIVIEPLSNILVNSIQVERKTIHETIVNPGPFYEIALDAEVSRRVHQIAVYVNDRKWQSVRLFRDTNEFSRCWTEFYNELDQLGIRFGNGVYGRVPDEDSHVRIELLLTDGETLLTSGQSLSPVSDDISPDLEFISGTVIDAGNDMEGTEETRRNALYYYLYDEKHEWSNDYRFMLKQRFPDLLFCQVWGEERQERMVGYRSLGHINHIFYAVYEEDRPTIGQEVGEELRLIPEYNRFFTEVPVEFCYFTIGLSGVVGRSFVLADIEIKIRELLYSHYGKNSRSRKKSALKKSIYKILNAMEVDGVSVFNTEADDIEITLNGQTEQSVSGQDQAMLFQMICIDLDNSNIELSYPKRIEYEF